MNFYSKEYATSPTMYLDSVFVMVTIDLHRCRGVTVADAIGSYPIPDMDKDVAMMIWDNLVS